MASKVEIINLEKLESMHTGTLMNRRAALLKCEESFESSDRVGYETKPSLISTGIIEFKDTPEWKRAYDDLKKVLGRREHLPNKQERKEMRQAKAKL